MSKNIIVIGSCNTDMVIKADRLPVPGETIIGGSFMMNPGGKGANGRSRCQIERKCAFYSQNRK